jgi:carbamoyltransferase
LEYLRATYHIGLGGYGSEGKTQGLAPYGKPTVFEAYMNEIEILPSGNLKLSAKLQSQHSQLVEDGGYAQTEHLNNAFLDAYSTPRIAPEPLTDVYLNLAASMQKVLEHVALEICRIMRKKTGETRLVLSGGVAMNSSMNGEILRSGIFEQISALPMASDRGTGLGAALYYVHHIEKVPRFYRLDSAYYGGEFNDEEAEQAMKTAGLITSRPADICAVAAEALAKSQIIGWFQGRSELGARALGNRSIMADPRRSEMKDIVNDRVKHREWFRPFAPAVLESRAEEYFIFPSSSADLSFMTFTVPAVPAKAHLIPATVHVDGSARVQTVKPEQNPLYARVIELFAEQTGVPVALNTSFNDMGEPIVETPASAVKTFLKGDMDLLCIGRVAGRKA